MPVGTRLPLKPARMGASSQMPMKERSNSAQMPSAAGERREAIPVVTESKPLTMRQQQVLEFIESFMMAKRYSPSMREIGEALGMNSPSTVFSHLDALERKGAISRPNGARRVPRAIVLIRPAHTKPCPTCSGRGWVPASGVA